MASDRPADGPAPRRLRPRDLAALELLGRPVWAFDLGSRRIVWANGAAVRFWRARDQGALLGPEFGAVLAASHGRMAEVLARRRGAEPVTERCTFYLADGPVTVDGVGSAVVLDDGRPALLVEAAPIDSGAEPALARGAEALRHTCVLIALYDADGGAVMRNPAALAAYPGPNHRFDDRFAEPAIAERAWAALQGGEPFSAEVAVVTAAGLRWHVVDARRTHDPSTGRDLVLVNERDLTELKRVEADLRERGRQLSAAQEVARLGDWRFEPGTGRFACSPQLYRIWGIDPATVTPTLAAVCRLIHRRDRKAAREVLRRAAEDGAAVETEFRIVQPSGAERCVRVQARGERDGRGGVVAVFGICQDVTERKRSEERIRYLAHHDALTGLPNRALFLDRLDQALARAAREDELVAVLQLDLDRFKDVNDTLGHAAGDHLLHVTADRLRRCLRRQDTVARVGGDEFVVLLPGLKRPTDAARAAEQIVRAVGEPVPYDGREIHTAASVGITVYPLDDTQPSQLVRNADIALYRAKAEGRGTYCFFVGGMKAEVERRELLETELRRALAEDEFSLDYQPEVDLAAGQVAGFEALLRWRHPERGPIVPAEFLAVAEESGLMGPIGELVLRRAALQMRGWLDAGLRPGRIAVNLAPAQFRRGDVARTIAALLRETGLAPACFEVEVTEGLFLGRHPETIAEALRRLDRMGVRITLDDFGVGYASLTHLKRFPVRRLKIDRSFVRDITTDPEDATIVRALIGLGHSLGMTVVAEGVETREQLDFLRWHECDYAFGRLFAGPLAGAEVPGFLADAPALVEKLRWTPTAAEATPNRRRRTPRLTRPN
jgi:diguanylate cyclase (GGDEF)-like protein/PAS domain S-box-containing protein